MSKQRVYKFALLMVALIILIMVINNNQPSGKSIICNNYTEAKFLVISGTVMNKYTNKRQHDQPTLVFEGEDGNRNLIFVYDKSGFFDYVDVGDQVNKSYGSYDIEVTRDSENRVFTMDYGIDCD